MADHAPRDDSGDVEVDSTAVAAAFGLPVAFFRTELRRGNVRGTVERGVGADAGRHRLVFRYRGQRRVLIRQPDGHLVPEEPESGAPPCQS